LRAAAAFLALTVLFAIEGRTGYLVLLALAAAAAWLHSPPRWRWIAVVAVPLAVLGLGLGSTAVQKRVVETLAGSQASDNGVMTSTAIRIELLRNGLYLAKQHFLVGTGFTSYAVVYQQAAQARRGADPAAPAGNYDPARVQNPHSEYLMQLVGGGIASLALFLAWLALPMLRKTPNGRVDASLAGISLAFAVACLFNTLLMDFVEGHVYVALLAWLLARNIETPATGTREAA
jgi:O-antigen ligase